MPVATGGNDLLTGTARADTISGLAGDDTIYGNESNDEAYGGGSLFDGNHTVKGEMVTTISSLCGGPGHDSLKGDAGDDSSLGESDGDLAYGGPGQQYSMAHVACRCCRGGAP